MKFVETLKGLTVKASRQADVSGRFNLSTLQLFNAKEK
jgi:hypothetical protein